MRQQLWRHLLTFKPFLVQASSIAADQTLITQPTAVARALCRSSFQDLQAAEALPPWMLSGFAYSRYFAVARSPVGALNETRLAKVLERYHNFDDPVIPKFHYGSHCSSVGTSLILVGQMRHLSTSGVSEASKQHASEDPQTSNKVSEEATSGDGEEVVEDPKETRPGWLLKVIVALTVSYMAFHGFPMIGESSIRHSLALLRAEDPLFKRSGASRLALFAKNDDKRRNVVKAGGIERLMSMLEGASDDQTRCEAIKALVSLAHCEEAVLALHEVRADAVFQALLRSSSDPDILKYSSVVLEKLDKGNCSSLGEDRAQKTESSLCIS